MDDLLQWSATQGHILTGGNKLEAWYPETNYVREDLPHYYLASGRSWEEFDRWLRTGRRSTLVTGAWERPLFCGGWKESTSSDTTVYNLQTPSIFIDLRIPVARPRSLCARRSLADCSLQELRVLARQHCFAGYTLVDFIDGAPVCTRHHCIDWNYHPCFPRSRPNRWRVLVSPDGSSFKEYGIANDEFGQAVYMERWARLPGDSGGKHFFAMRALPLTPYDEGISGHPCHCNRHPSRVACGGSCGGAQNKGGSDPQPPQQATCGCDASTRVESPSAGDAILVVIGQHFVFVEDRRRLRAGSALDAFQGPGGCANLVDAAHAAGDRAAMEDLLQLEGCYGRIPVPPSAATPAATGARMMSNGDQVIEASGGAGRDAAAPVATGVGDGWKILASTHPWREGQLLLRPGDVQELVADPGNPGDGPTSVLVWRGRQWRVLECSMPWAELRAMFWVLRSAL